MDTGDIVEQTKFLRGQVLVIATSTKRLMGHAIFREVPEPGTDHNEMRENIMLTYRHLEDARMRLGKVIQAADGGTSVYPA